MVAVQPAEMVGECQKRGQRSPGTSRCHGCPTAGIGDACRAVRSALRRPATSTPAEGW
jgi:hypothetical protein